MKSKTNEAARHLWHATKSEAYQVAHLVCSQGVSGRKIARTLFSDLVQAGHEPTALERVRALIRFAAANGILQFNTFRVSDLEKRLQAEFGTSVDFRVVDDQHEVRPALRNEAIAAEGAAVVAEKLCQIMAGRKPGKHPIVVANAGGSAVSSVAQALSGRKLIPAEASLNQLRFISLNSASIPTDYGFSANVLAVRLAEVYGAQHIALSPVWPKDVAEQYHQALKDIDLLICGAGARAGFFSWYEKQEHFHLPNQTVGDFCLIPLDPEGHPIRLSSRIQGFVKKLQPQPSYSNLSRLAARGRVILILLSPPGWSSVAGGPNITDPAHTSKVAIARAILKGCLTSTCILGASLATEILKGDG